MPALQKVVSLRLGEEQAGELAAVARTDEVNFTEAVREAIDTHIAARRSDPDFQKRLRRRLEEEHEILLRLSEDVDGDQDAA
ncbi:MAG TPA: hypothetical protein VFU11_05115 [Solirubrobacterales bacterium]|nr:hypothetical protein [Solirubrobacterales bacterium]